jgi:ABC-type lipoprotein release transport system permease subunit
VGTIIGTAAALAQQIFGIITIPGNYVLFAFPVEIRITDILLTFIGVSLIGFLISRIPCKKIFKN